MSIQTDFHLHSSFSGDSDSSMEEMILRAIQLNLHTICFTEHMDMDFPYGNEDPKDMFLLNTDSYLFDLLYFREKYKKQISILFGVEIGLQPHLISEISNYANAYDFDFILASSHLCHNVDPYKNIFFEGREEKVAHQEYFESILENIEVHSNFDVYGHLDYVIRYGPTKNENYSYQQHKDIIDEILKRLIADGKGIEINTSGYKYGLGSPHPSFEILSRYRELGGRIITIGSDGHKPDHLAYAFNQAEQLLLRCGFQEYTVFEKRKPSFLKLE